MNAHSSNISMAGMIPSTSETLATRAMIVTLTISQWGGSSLDREVTDEVTRAHKAADGSGAFSKYLLPKSALEPIGKIARETREQFNKRSLPWLDARAGRIMDAKVYLNSAKWFSGRLGIFNDAVDVLCNDYSKHIADAQVRLGTMFNARDYPDVRDLRARFSMALEPMPVPTGNDFRVTLAEDQARHIQAGIEKRVTEAANAAMRDVYNRIMEACEAMVDRLTSYKPAVRKGDKTVGIFRDTLVTNVSDLIEILPSLNIMGDPRLTDLTVRLRALVEYNSDTLRASAAKRRDVAHEAQSILDSMSDFMS